MNPKCPATPFCLLVFSLSSLAGKPAHLLPLATSIRKICLCSFHYLPRHCFSTSLPTWAEGWGRPEAKHCLSRQTGALKTTAKTPHTLIVQPFPVTRGWGCRACSSLERECLGGSNSHPIITLRLSKRWSQVLPAQCTLSNTYDCICDYLLKK